MSQQFTKKLNPYLRLQPFIHEDVPYIEETTHVLNFREILRLFSSTLTAPEDLNCSVAPAFHQ